MLSWCEPTLCINLSTHGICHWSWSTCGKLLGRRDSCELGSVKPVDYWLLNRGYARRYGLGAKSRIYFHDIVQCGDDYKAMKAQCKR